MKKVLPESDKMYSDEELTNVSTRFILAEFVREKVLELTRDEIPHTVTCYVENYEEDEKIVHVQVVIVVDYYWKRWLYVKRNWYKSKT